jgi:hypothetical protein
MSPTDDLDATVDVLWISSTDVMPKSAWFFLERTYGTDFDGFIPILFRTDGGDDDRKEFSFKR